MPSSHNSSGSMVRRQSLSTTVGSGIQVTMPLSEGSSKKRQVSEPVARMTVGVLSLIGVFIASYLLLHKFGVVGTLACGTGDWGVVEESRWAIFLGVPVPAWGVIGYTMIFGTAILSIQPRWIGDRRIGLFLFVMATIAFLFSAFPTASSSFLFFTRISSCVVS